MERALFIASAYDNKHPLDNVIGESDGIRETVNRLTGWRSFHTNSITLKTIEEAFSKRDFCYQAFHFAGHAVDKTLQFNEQEKISDAFKYSQSFMAGVGGLAKIIRTLHPVQLVFLNGCSTKTQVDAFKIAGVPAIIYTTRALNDYLGKVFAQSFYKAFFKDKNTLEDAFTLAEGSVELVKPKLGGEIYNAEVEAFFNRDIGGLADLTEECLYKLYADDAFKKLTWEQWPQNLEQMPPAARDVPANAVADPLHLDSKEIPSTAIHRCDRKRQADTFHAQLEQLASGQLAGPVFFFIHDDNKACPDSLVERFKNFSASELCESNPAFDKNRFVWKDMALPDGLQLRNPDHCKSRLFEIYNHHLFKCQHDPANRNYIFQPNTQGDKVFIIHHDLTELEPETADEIKILLEFYLSEFSSKVVTELGAKLAIVFSYLYFQEEEDFETLFETLSTDARYEGRVINLTDMDNITLKHVGIWQKRVFKDRVYPTPPGPEELFPFGEQANQPMAAVQKVLAEQLALYNQKIKSHYG